MSQRGAFAGRGRGFGRGGARGGAARGFGGIGAAGPMGAGACFRCGRLGHIASQCFATTYVAGGPIMGGYNATQTVLGNPGDVCGCCGQDGHGRAACNWHRGNPRKKLACCVGGQGTQGGAGTAGPPVGQGIRLPANRQGASGPRFTGPAFSRDGDREEIVSVETFTAAAVQDWNIMQGSGMAWTRSIALAVAGYQVVSIEYVKVEFVATGDTGGIWIFQQRTTDTKPTDVAGVAAAANASYMRVDVQVPERQMGFVNARGEPLYSRHFLDAARAGAPAMRVVVGATGAVGMVRVRVGLLKRGKFATS